MNAAVIAAANLRKAAELAEQMEGLSAQYRQEYNALVTEYNQLLAAGSVDVQGAGPSNGQAASAPASQARPSYTAQPKRKPGVHHNVGRRFSPESIAKISKAQKRRWKRVKAEQQAASIGSQIPPAPVAPPVAAPVAAAQPAQPAPAAVAA